ncbi:MAG: alanine racemase [Lachnospiraceae bacterium]|nr:alanine racemase [Lachnospiraceae bacterium]
MREAVLKQLKNKNQTPAYVFDVKKLEHRVSEVKQILGNKSNIGLCYAMKANPFLLGTLDDLVDKFEVCSPGELSICKQNDIAMEKIIFSGVNKEYEDIRTAMEYGVEMFTVESWKHLKLLEQCACEKKKTVDILIRLSSDNQFGVDKSNVCQMVEKREDFKNVHICGIHFYSGTQKKVAKVGEELRELINFCNHLKTEYMFHVEHLEYGPGLLVDYFAKEENDSQILQDFGQLLNEVGEQFPLTVEMGRFLVADCGNFVTKVVDVKNTNQQQYCIVDGGINHVNYYGQVMGVRIPPVRFYRKTDDDYIEEKPNAEMSKNEGICVCGSLCTSADVLVRNIAIKDVKEDDLFVFEKIGAYSVTESMYLFLSRKLPKVFLCKNGILELLRDSYETYEWNCKS